MSEAGVAPPDQTRARAAEALPDAQGATVDSVSPPSVSAVAMPAGTLSPHWAANGSYVLHRPGGWHRAAAKYLAVFESQIRTQLAYTGQFAVRGIFVAMILYVFLQLWRVTYAAEDGALIAGLTLGQMLWYLAITESIILSRMVLSRTVDQEVRTGDIAYVLLRPYGYAGYRFASYMAERLLRFVITLTIGCGLALLYVGPVPVAALDVGGALVALLLAMVLDFLGAFAIGLLAFWVEDTSSMALIYDRLIMLLGGMMLPLDVFPGWLGSVARALPFSSLVYGPARLAIGGSPEAFLMVVTKQVLFLALAFLGLRALYGAAMRRVNVNGG